MNTERLLKTRRLYLRPYEAGDGAALYRMLSDAETIRYTPYPVLSRADCDREAAERAENPAFYAVCLTETDEMIGSLCLLDCGMQTAELAYLFLRSVWGNGYATEAAGALLQTAFTRLSYRRVTAVCDTENTAACRLAEKLGMTREGTLRENIYYRTSETGKPLWRSTHLYGLLKNEFTACSAAFPS